MPTAQWALLGSLTAYPSLYISIIPPNPPFVAMATTREAISIFHCTLQTILSVICLEHNSSSLSSTTTSHGNYLTIRDSQTPIIATKSTFANSITAIETGYLLQDSIVLLHAYHQRSKLGHAGLGESQQLKGWNMLHLGLHHAILGSLLLILQYYIIRGRERGILIIVALHLMNVSSVPGTVRWFLRNFHTHRKRLIHSTTVVYLAAFATFRVYLIYWILDVFGKQQGVSAWTAMRGLRTPCMIGTGTIAVVNSAWLVYGVRNFALRILGERRAKTK